MNRSDLNDTSGCPVGARCESCGTTTGSLAVETASSPRGVICLTLCRRCASYSAEYPMPPATAARLVDQHRQHLSADDRTGGQS